MRANLWPSKSSMTTPGCKCVEVGGVSKRGGSDVHGAKQPKQFVLEQILCSRD
jgi:hypothetical protein